MFKQLLLAFVAPVPAFFDENKHIYFRISQFFSLNIWHVYFGLLWVNEFEHWKSINSVFNKILQKVLTFSDWCCTKFMFLSKMLQWINFSQFVTLTGQLKAVKMIWPGAHHGFTSRSCFYFILPLFYFRKRGKICVCKFFVCKRSS